MKFPGEHLVRTQEEHQDALKSVCRKLNESMQFKMAVTYADGKVLARLYDINLENKYEGYGKNVRNETFPAR